MRLLHFAIALPLCASFACGGGSSKESSGAADTTTVVGSESEEVTFTEAELLWETDTVLTTVESVLHQDGTLYAACINGKPTDKDGNGFIATLDMEGNITNPAWATGVHAPKGMTISEGKLYVTDIDRVVAFDLASGDKVAEYPVEGAEFLNDMTSAADGTVYFTDMRRSKLHSIGPDGTVNTLIEGTPLNKPNGIYHMGDYMLLASNGDQSAQKLVVESKMTEILAMETAASDGIVADGHGGFVISSWTGHVWHVSADGTKNEVLSTEEAGKQTADIEYIAESQLLLVPTFFSNTVAAYKLK